MLRRLLKLLIMKQTLVSISDWKKSGISRGKVPLITQWMDELPEADSFI